MNSVLSQTHQSLAARLPTWRIVKLGTPGKQSFDDYRAAFKKAGCQFGYDSAALFSYCRSGFFISPKEYQVELVMVSVSQLGFPNYGAERANIYARAKEHGFDFCPLETCLCLRLEYMNQPKHESIMVAVEPLDNSESSQLTWRIAHDESGFCLYGLYNYPDDTWNEDYRWVFCRGK